MVTSPAIVCRNCGGTDLVKTQESRVSADYNGEVLCRTCWSTSYTLTPLELPANTSSTRAQRSPMFRGQALR